MRLIYAMDIFRATTCAYMFGTLANQLDTNVVLWGLIGAAGFIGLKQLLLRPI